MRFLTLALIVVSVCLSHRSAGSAPPPEALWQPEQAATPAGRRLIALLGELRRNVRTTRYQHQFEVRQQEGFYGWDCSLLAAWVLRRAAPVAFRALGEKRPLASDFYRAIDRAPTARGRRGWQRLGHVSKAQPGDVFAWLRSPLSTSKVSGHVGFFVDAPAPVPALPGAFVARIVDATSLPHQADTRANDGVCGFGFGTFLFVTDAAGEPAGPSTGETVAYGWFGTESPGLMPARVIFGRVWR